IAPFWSNRSECMGDGSNKAVGTRLRRLVELEHFGLSWSERSEGHTDVCMFARGRNSQMIPTVVVGHGLAGRSFHCPLIRREAGWTLHGIVARDPQVRADAMALWGEHVRGYAGLDESLAD